jgi:hypothetical protein
MVKQRLRRALVVNGFVATDWPTIRAAMLRAAWRPRAAEQRRKTSVYLPSN